MDNVRSTKTVRQTEHRWQTKQEERDNPRRNLGEEEKIIKKRKESIHSASIRKSPGSGGSACVSLSLYMWAQSINNINHLTDLLLKK